jgi:ATP-dependent helicase/nuclease subunit B
MKKLTWSWDAPVLEKAVAHLLRGWQPEHGALDLSGVLLLVPSMEAGRRLKEALARATAVQGSGAFIPWVWTPEMALSPPGSSQPTATRLQCQMAWQRALQTVPIEALTALFPTLPELRGWSWEQEMAAALAELKSLLGAGGLTFAEAAERLERDAARWRDLARLESAFFKHLTEEGLAEPQSAKRDTAAAPVLPEGVRAVLVLPAPDLPPLLSTWLAACAQRGLDVTVCIHAPPELAASFDAAGRPLIGHWGEAADHHLPLPQEHIHACHDLAAQASRTLDLVRTAAPQGRTAIGVGDPESAAVLAEKLRVEGVRVFEPGGVLPTQTGLWHVLEQMQTLLTSGSWAAFASLLRVPDVRQGLLRGQPLDPTSSAESAEGTQSSHLRLLEQADHHATTHLPVSLEHALELLDAGKQPALAQALHGMQALLSRMRQLPLADAARELLLCFYGERDFVPNERRDHLLQSLGEAWLGVCQEVQEEVSRFQLQASAGELLALSLQMLQDRALSEPRGEVDLVLHGWLELLWEPAPHLIITGVNEEHVPGIQTAHPFLPDQARESLGLPCQATRFSRDAYLLRALAEMRAASGSLHLLFGQWGARGDALRPSRLLLLCPDAELPSRVEHLFPKEETAAHEAEPPRTLLWRLRPRLTAPAVETISPTRLRDYLACPFRDFCTNELGMAAVDPGRRELDSAGYGTLAHHAFHQLALHDGMKLSTSAQDIADFLIEAARQEMHRLFGRRPAPLITLQFDALTQSLRYAAEVEAAQRLDGWRIHAAELKIGTAEETAPLRIEGALFKGKIDRVDRHEKSGHLRLIDFKTSNKARDPREAHADKISARRQLCESDVWKTFEHDGKTWMWRDLQLPLYAAALRQRGQRVDAVGYFCLPKNVQDTGILLWDAFDQGWEQRALDCAAEAVRRLREGRFWPPAAKPSFKPSYEEIFLGDALATVEPISA